MKRVTSMLLCLLMLFSISAFALPNPSSSSETVESDSALEYAQIHLSNTLPFLKEDELSFLPEDASVSLGSKIAMYDSTLTPLPYSAYPVFYENDVIAIATVTEDEFGEKNFQVGMQFANELSDFIQEEENNQIAVIVEEDSICLINSQNESVMISNSETSNVPSSSALPNGSANLSTSVISPSVSVSAALVTRSGTDSGTVPVKYVPQGNHPLCWASCMASIVNYYKGTNYGATQIANTVAHYNGQGEYTGATIEECAYWYNSTYNIISHQSNSKLSYDTVYSNASNGKPIHAFCSNYTNPSDDGHYVVVRGCYISNSVVYYRIMNPWSPSSGGGLLVVQMRSDGSFDIVGDDTFRQNKYLYFS